MTSKSHVVAGSQYLAGLAVKNGAQGLLRLVELASGNDNGVLNGRDHDLRINTLLSTDRLDYVVQFTRHDSFTLMSRVRR